mmetsp:Transcript_4614/g.10879  ORF Transcript_4614/g.10879 Transcript_4614/m.10879 type:complete len:89 (+) Transcript_4614:51-317(+)
MTRGRKVRPCASVWQCSHYWPAQSRLECTVGVVECSGGFPEHFSACRSVNRRAAAEGVGFLQPVIAVIFGLLLIWLGLQAKTVQMLAW